MSRLRRGDDRARSFFGWLLTHRGPVLGALAVLIGLSALGAVRTRIDYTIEQLFPARGAVRQTFEEYKRSFSKEDTRFSFVWRDTRGSRLELYRDMERIAGAFEAAGLEDVDWAGSLQVIEPAVPSIGIDPRVHALIEADRRDEAHVSEALARHRDDPLYRGYLWNADQTAFAIHGYLAPRQTADAERRAIEEELTARLEGIDLPGESALGGIPVIRSRLPKLLQSDQQWLLGGGFIVLCGILLVYFRHLGHALICLTSALPAYLVTLGVMGFAGIEISVLTSFIPIIVLVVGVSDSIHLVARFRSERGRLSDTRAAVVSAFGRLAVPCFYTSITTAVGFAALAGTRIGIVVEFGLFTAFAILTAYAFGMTLQPVLLGLTRRERFDDRGLEARWMRGLVGLATARTASPSGRTLVVFTAVASLGLAAATRLRPNTLLLDDLQPRSPLLRDLQWIESQGFGLFQVNLFLRADGGRPLHDPEALAWMERFQSFVSEEPVVVGSLGLPDFFRQLGPASADEASRLLGLARRHDPGFAEAVYHPDAGEAQLIVTVRDEGSVEILPFLDRVDRFLAEDPPPVGTAAPTGTVYLLQSYQARILESFGPSIAIAIVVITGIMVFMFRSFRFGLLALIPNLFPLVVLLGVMWLVQFDLKPSTILVFSIAFGIAADDTIHLLARLGTALRAGDSVTRSLERSVRDAGPAILMTTVVVGAGFSLLMASQFEVLFMVGLMTAVSALAAVAADLFAFPAVLTATADLMGRRPSPGAHPRLDGFLTPTRDHGSVRSSRSTVQGGNHERQIAASDPGSGLRSLQRPESSRYRSQ